MRAVSADRSRTPRGPQASPSTYARQGFAETFAAPISPKSDHTVSSEMLDMKLGRKQAESELQQLANRVALLKIEEQRAAEKVAETKARAAEILAIKKRNEEKLHVKIQQNQIREQQVRALQAKAAADREERQRKLSQTRKALGDTRRATAEQKKHESKKIEDVVHHGRERLELEKRAKAEAVRKREEAMRTLREREKFEREQESMREYARKMAEENQRKLQAQEMIDLLERQEQELLERLRKSQEEQQEAYFTLQKSLRS